MPLKAGARVNTPPLEAIKENPILILTDKYFSICYIEITLRFK